MKRATSGKVIQEITARLACLEKAVFKSNPKRGTEKPEKVSANKRLPAQILTLKDQDFFKKPKTASEVHARLESKYPCEHDRVAMALLRLQRRRQLRKTSKLLNKKKQVAYVW